MDDPGISLFQGKELKIGGDENLEEAEDLEEQIKRREELQNLLLNALDDFKYEDSTINSSTNISVASADCMEQAYKDVQTPYEQLKLLYDIRMREIEVLKEEFDSFRENSTKEINTLKRKLTLQEAETSQVEICLKNTKSLLVEKADIIDKQDKDLFMKNKEIEDLKKSVEHLQYDVQAYKSMIEELQLKLTMDTGPFNVAARVFNAEQLQNNHKNQVENLEMLLEEQRKKTDILEKEKMQLEEDLQRIIKNNEENELLHNNTIALLSANVESAQNQCRDLLNLVEMLSKENEHYKGRVHKLEASEPILLSNSFKRKSLDYETLATHNERLKKMLLDKDVEVSTLKSKVKFYESDVRNQPEHSEKISLIQNEMKNMRQTLIEKDEEISELTLVNKELEDKIENMIIQTRTDLENLSQKYKLPELETMNEELQNAEIKIKELQQNYPNQKL
ncbi:hypothetical protein HHI36_008609 [Cryptolaemus montrouzieri]|uniref:Uncharacterized protein n=1 Tax=Cryptolaemus montrouzieri TaxID=559131 RepID=A0ABD2MSX9_9CUCU